MLVNSLRTTVASRNPFDVKKPRPRPRGHHLRDRPLVDATGQAVEIYPPDVVQRRAVSWGGIAAEIVQATRREKLEFRFRAPLHLLTVCDQGVRSDGDTFVEGLPRSRLRDVRRKLTLVPAGTSIMMAGTALSDAHRLFLFRSGQHAGALGAVAAPARWPRGCSSTTRHWRTRRASSCG